MCSIAAILVFVYCGGRAPGCGTAQYAVWRMHECFTYKCSARISFTTACRDEGYVLCGSWKAEAGRSSSLVQHERLRQHLANCALHHNLAHFIHEDNRHIGWAVFSQQLPTGAT